MAQEKNIMASDLRVGNYYDHYGEVKKVTPNIIQEVWDAQRTWCKPILLTYNILINFGFEFLGENDFNYRWIKNNIILSARSQDKLNVQFHWDCGYLKIEYTHQLQNLYFSLTNTELTFKQ
jgi:hypothetical protein